MLVKVGKFIFLVDFVVIDIEEDKKIPLLLGRPFLATGVALIDVKKGELTLQVGIKEVHFSLNQCLKQHDVEQTHCMKIDSVNSVYKKMNDDLMNENSFDDYISSSLYDDNFEKEKIMAKTVLSLNIKNLSSEEKVQVEEKSSEGLVLKELPKNLKYVFLEEERSKPIIIAVDLMIEKEKKMVKILRRCQKAIVWSIEDLNGINPSVCMHKILMEENAKISIEQ